MIGEEREVRLAQQGGVVVRVCVFLFILLDIQD